MYRQKRKGKGWRRLIGPVIFEIPDKMQVCGSRTHAQKRLHDPFPAYAWRWITNGDVCHTLQYGSLLLVIKVSNLSVRLISSKQ